MKQSLKVSIRELRLMIVPLIACVLLVLVCVSNVSAEPPKGAAWNMWGNRFGRLWGDRSNRVASKGFNFRGNIVDATVSEDVEAVEKARPTPSSKLQALPEPQAPIGQLAMATTTDELEQQQMRSADRQLLERIDSKAPKQVPKMLSSLIRGDQAGVEEQADQFVDYLVNLMLRVQQLSAEFAAALVRRGIVEPESMVGFEQLMAKTFANARKASGNPIGLTHKDVLARVKADPKGEVVVYYFFTLSCSYCRYMAPDMERIWQVAKLDKKVKMIGLTMNQESEKWIKSYRKHSGVTFPIENGKALAKQFEIGFVPAVVVVTPNTKISVKSKNKQGEVEKPSKMGTAYIRSGQQQFDRLYQFVRTAQGLPVSISNAVRKIINTPIGFEQYAKIPDKGAAKGDMKTVSYRDGNRSQGKREIDLRASVMARSKLLKNAR